MPLLLPGRGPKTGEARAESLMKSGAGKLELKFTRRPGGRQAYGSCSGNRCMAPGQETPKAGIVLRALAAIGITAAAKGGVALKARRRQRARRAGPGGPGAMNPAQHRA